MVGPKKKALALPLKAAAARNSRRSNPRPARRIRFSRPVASTVVLGALASATVLVVAEFLTLYSVRVIRGSASVPPVAAGTENHYALIPIALLGLILALAAIRLGDRWALAAVAALGLIALLIGLVHDLPDARRTGLVGSLHTGWVRGASSPNIGMYLETLGSVMLVLTAGLGLLFGEPVVEEASARDKAPVPYGVESDAGAAPAETAAVAEAPAEAAAAAEAPAAEGGAAPVEDVTSVGPGEVVPKPAAKRPPSTPRKRSTSSGPKRSTGKGARSSSSAKRAPSGARKQSTKRTPSNAKRGGSPAPRTSSRPKRSES